MIITLMHWPPRRRSNRTGSRTAPQPFLSDSHWLLIADVLADPPPSAKGGRPRVPPRACLEGVLWVLVNGARWQDLPRQYPSPSTCWRRSRLDPRGPLRPGVKTVAREDRSTARHWDASTSGTTSNEVGLHRFWSARGALDKLLTALSRVRRGSLPFDDTSLGLGKWELTPPQRVASIVTRENRSALFRRGSLPGSG